MTVPMPGNVNTRSTGSRAGDRERYMRGHVPAAVVRAHADAIFDGTGASRRDLEKHIEDFAGAAKLRECHHVAAPHIFERSDVGQIERGPHAGSARFHVLAVRLDAPNARRLSRRLNDDRLTAAQRATE